MERKPLLVMLFIVLALCALLVPGSVLADGPGPVAISEFSLQSAVDDAAATQIEGATFRVDKMAAGTPLLGQYPENVYSFLSYASNTPDPAFFPTPQSEFYILESPMCFNTYFAVLHHSFTGLQVYHAMLPPGGSFPADVQWVGALDDPTFVGEAGDIWRHVVCYDYPPEPWRGNWLYFALVIPSDGDSNIFNSRAIHPINIDW